MKPDARSSEHTAGRPAVRTSADSTTERVRRPARADVPEGLLDHMGRARELVRADVVAQARLRLVEGPRPSAAEVADSLVEHLVSARGAGG